MSLLIIEDEPNVLSAIKRGLSEYGFEISVALNGLTGLEMALTHSYDLIILDVMMPGLDGIQVCKQLREKGRNMPILMLTALDSTQNIVSALDNGADDYLVKPFKMPELAARIRTLLRRVGNYKIADDENSFKIDELELNSESKIVSYNKTPFSLTPTEFRLLEYFIRNQKKVLSRIQILDYVWDIDFNLGTNVVDVYVNYLRKKLEKHTKIKLIHTVFGMGYIMKPQE